MVKIELPKSMIDFEIGEEHFELSLSDVSRSKYLEEYNKMSLQETSDINKRDIELTNYNQQLANLEAKYSTDERMTESSYKKQRNSLAEQFEKKMIKSNNDRIPKQLALMKKFLDKCFGDGNGEKIYKICGESSVIFAGVISQIANEIQNQSNITDFYDKMKNKIQEMKPDEPIDKQPADLQESDISH